MKSRSTSPRNPAGRATRPRDYRTEYQHRVKHGIAKGLTRSQARGHARAGERPKPTKLAPINPKSAEESAIRMMKSGVPLRTAAKLTHVSEQNLRRYVKENVGASRVGRRWIINDQRPRRFPLYSDAQLKAPMLNPSETSRASKFMHAVGPFLSSGELEFLAPHIGQGVTDVQGRFHPFETDPNRLYELDARGELNFPEFYKIINQGDH